MNKLFQCKGKWLEPVWICCLHLFPENMFICMKKTKNDATGNKKKDRRRHEHNTYENFNIFKSSCHMDVGANQIHNRGDGEHDEDEDEENNSRRCYMEDETKMYLGLKEEGGCLLQHDEAVVCSN